MATSCSIYSTGLFCLHNQPFCWSQGSSAQVLLLCEAVGMSYSLLCASSITSCDARVSFCCFPRLTCMTLGKAKCSFHKFIPLWRITYLSRWHLNKNSKIVINKNKSKIFLLNATSISNHPKVHVLDSRLRQCPQTVWNNKYSWKVCRTGIKPSTFLQCGIQIQ